MKIGILGADIFTQGKVNLIDNRVKVLKAMFNSAKEVHLQVDIISDQDKLVEADGIISPESAKLDLIVHDIEFLETRLSRSEDQVEKSLLSKCKDQLDKEGLVYELALSDAEKELISGYSLWTMRPVYLFKNEELQDKNSLLFNAYTCFGYISFFTAGDKDSHAWSIKKGSTAWDAAGAIHSDIQKGFIRAEVTAYQELVNDGSLSRARTNNHISLQMKDYVVQDGDYLVIRTNK